MTEKPAPAAAAVFHKTNLPQIGGEAPPADPLVEFARYVLRGIFDADLDCGDIQDKAAALGLLVNAPGGYDPDVHGEDDFAEPGDPWFELSPLLQLKAAP